MPSCPWSSFEPTTLHFCEAARCSWIAQPANTWSNLAFVAVGLLILRQSHREPTLRWFGIMAILVGLCSFFYHASLTFVGEVLDLGSMFLFSSLLLSLNLRRLGALSTKSWFPFYAGLNLASLLLLVFLKTVGIWIFGAQIGAAIILELVIMRRVHGSPRQAHYGYFWTTLGVFGVAYGIWLLDFRRIACDPASPFQGHAVWHVLAALCFYFSYRFYNQSRAV